MKRKNSLEKKAEEPPDSLSKCLTKSALLLLAVFNIGVGTLFNSSSKKYNSLEEVHQEWYNSLLKEAKGLHKITMPPMYLATYPGRIVRYYLSNWVL